MNIKNKEEEEYKLDTNQQLKITDGIFKQQMLPFLCESYAEQKVKWPQFGQKILTNYNQEWIILYQAFNNEIADYAIKNQRFGGPNFLNARMTWVKPNFLWMMYRSGWAQKKDQNRVLALKVKRELFEKEILKHAVESSWNKDVFPQKNKYKVALETSEIRLQWDPDHSPRGGKCQRRAMQIGVKGTMAKRFSQSDEFLLSITDITQFVQEQRQYIDISNQHLLMLPVETEYNPEQEVRFNLGMLSQKSNQQQEEENNYQ